MTASFDIRNSAFIISPLIASEQKLLMIRPCQVYQVKNIVQCSHDNCGRSKHRFNSANAVNFSLN